MKKKIKKYAGGGLSGIASEATSLLGAVDNAANAINTIKSGSAGQVALGGQGPIGGSGALGLMNTSNPAQGLKLNSGDPGIYNQLLSQQKGFAAQLSGLANSGKSISFKKGGKVSSASKRADGIAMKGKTKGRIV